MLSLDLTYLSVKARHPYLTELAAVAESLRKAHGSRVAVDYLLKCIGLRLSEVHDDGYLSEALDYHLGLLYAHLGDPDRAAAHIESSRVLPGTGGDRLFSDHSIESMELQRQVLDARARGMPTIVLASMPRAASASLTQSLAATMGSPILRASAGSFPSAYLVPSWLNSLSPGGAVLHDHFGASASNLKVLEDCHCRDVFVLVRDPRAAAASAVNFWLAEWPNESSRAQAEERIVQSALDAYYPWLAEWIAAARSTTLRVRWIKTTDVTANLVGTITGMLEYLRPHYAAVAGLQKSVKEVKANFVVGKDDAWRSFVSPANQARLWSAIPPEAIELLDLRE